MLASIVIRTYNEQKHLDALLGSVAAQKTGDLDWEVVVVDSGSTDGTLDIVASYDTRPVRIDKEDFTFGRSLNLGCKVAKGDFLVFVSGHCIPVEDSWLQRLTAPLVDGDIVYTYGRQVGDNTSRFSECVLFNKYYPAQSRIPQEGFFCNNANSAILRSVWAENPFDEELTGLEDMELAKRLVDRGAKIGYVAEAPVYHLHSETWRGVRLRYEREAIALRHIMPQVHVGSIDFMRYYFTALWLDIGQAMKEGRLGETLGEIVLFRLMQYWGTYRGNHKHRELSHRMKEEYFYPK
jgi:rhamnosyltransferase